MAAAVDGAARMLLRLRRREQPNHGPAVNDGPADDDELAEENNPEERPTTSSHAKRRCVSYFRWWADEYRCAIVCMTGLALLAVLLWHFDGKLAPDFGPGIELDMIIIAIMTLVRITLGSIVEACICQGAWIWVQSRIRRGHKTRRGWKTSRYLAKRPEGCWAVWPSSGASRVGRLLDSVSLSFSNGN